MNKRSSSFGDFRCANCRTLVSCAHWLSGVNNRNHCPYCLWSCHLGLFVPGDRLSACKAPMKPVALTMKRGRNKYERGPRGELMLVHECSGCKSLSINRIAADDDSGTVEKIFRASLTSGDTLYDRCNQNGIEILRIDDIDTLYTQLYGRTAKIPAAVWG